MLLHSMVNGKLLDQVNITSKYILTVLILLAAAILNKIREGYIEGRLLFGAFLLLKYLFIEISRSI
ncbi:hypothetical protein QD46_17765 [Paenibacillus polymyxa]|nr:hypothetical protein QD46_17765 [Paenibacillus polymyxa]